MLRVVELADHQELIPDLAKLVVDSSPAGHEDQCETPDDVTCQLRRECQVRGFRLRLVATRARHVLGTIIADKRASEIAGDSGPHECLLRGLHVVSEEDTPTVASFVARSALDIVASQGIRKIHVIDNSFKSMWDRLGFIELHEDLGGEGKVLEHLVRFAYPLNVDHYPDGVILKLADCREACQSLSLALFNQWPELWKKDLGYCDAAELEGQHLKPTTSHRYVLPLTLVAMLGGKVLGSVTLEGTEVTQGFLMDLPGRDYLEDVWLGALQVGAQHRKHGVGTKLVKCAEHVAHQLGYDRILTWTTASAPFYAKRGWVVTGQSAHHGSPVVLMNKELSAENRKE